jgi:hypothetical protein
MPSSQLYRLRIGDVEAFGFGANGDHGSRLLGAAGSVGLSRAVPRAMYRHQQTDSPWGDVRRR